MTKYEFDIIVVGGGPAGSSAAYSAAKNGMSVALIEKEECIAQTVRTSGVTWMDEIQKYKIPKDCYNIINNFEFYSPNNMASITISNDNSDTNDNSDQSSSTITVAGLAAVLDVRKTYRWLAAQAQRQGAKIFVDTTVQHIIKDATTNKIIGVKAVSNKKEVQFYGKIIIDASGFQSIVARSAKVVKPWKKFGVGAEYEAQVEYSSAVESSSQQQQQQQQQQQHTWQLMVGQKYSPAGYAWIFPLAKNIVRIGVGIGKPNSTVDPTQLLNQLIKNKKGPIKKLGKIKPIEFHYGLIPNDGLVRQTVFDNLILVGDSAGHANPLVLEGIRYAIKFGRVAGEVAANAIKQKDTTAKTLQQYQKIWKKEIESKIKSAGRIQDRWMSLTDKQWDQEIQIISHLTPQQFIDFIKADFGLSDTVKLAVTHPKLAVRQLFSMIITQKHGT